ncbi:hypothetical protein EYB26_006961 [Talaromyces marneffei]|uniref:uncharacterized protein n=1 Tax=Talaromyces marneffei TaxID=37727 RepID=UPI0012AA404A|nr:uncharacterized protein EYB26_006961 [Talaromyces marneffei]QGA19272.1 hypothetical protein EYB26_006961 [Talaromyces marneffei]
MINLKIVISALALSALAASAPTLGRSFSINQVPINVSRVHPAAEYARVYLRHGVNVPHHVALAARSPHADSVPAYPYPHDVLYRSPVKVGNDILLLALDTSSADLWVKTKFSPRAGTHVYDQSTGTLLPYHHWQIRYSDGGIAGGDVYKDIVKIGDITSYEQGVETLLYLHTSHSLLTDGLDGVVGLAFPSLNTVLPTPQGTFYENVKLNLLTPVFAASLKHHAPGSFDFGFIDHTKHTGGILYKHVDPTRGYWNISCDGYAIGGGAITFDEPFYAVIDTTGSLVLLKESIVNMYYVNIRSAFYSLEHGGWIFDCHDLIPSFSVRLGNYKITIPGPYLKYTEIPGTPLCYGGLQKSPHDDYGILGVMLLKTQYVIFDARSGRPPRVGFSKQRPPV